MLLPQQSLVSNHGAYGGPEQQRGFGLSQLEDSGELKERPEREGDLVKHATPWHGVSAHYPEPP